MRNEKKIINEQKKSKRQLSIKFSMQRQGLVSSFITGLSYYLCHCIFEVCNYTFFPMGLLCMCVTVLKNS